MGQILHLVFKFFDGRRQLAHITCLHQGHHQIRFLAQRARLIDGHAPVFQTPSNAQCNAHKQQGKHQPHKGEHDQFTQ